MYLVRAGETVYVLAASDNALSKLGEMPREALPVSEPLEPQSFSAVLKRAIGVKLAESPTSAEAAPPRSGDAPTEPS